MSASQSAVSVRTSSYVYGIDLVRFACALSVAVFHLTWMTAGIQWLLPFGWVGVQVFFVISGLVIANSAQGASAQQFLTGRFLRLYPAAWCAAIVSYPILLVEFPKLTDHAQRLYFSLILFPGPFLASSYWTLPVELAFYFVIYSVIVFRGFAHIEGVAIALILWSAPYLIALALYSHGSLHGAWIDFDYGMKNMSLLRHGPYFALGILIWLFKEKRLSKTGIAVGLFALGLCLMEIDARAIEVLPKFAGSVSSGPSASPHLTASAYLAFCAALAAILISVRFNERFPAGARGRKIVRLLGLTTYPFYLLHERLGEFVVSALTRLHAPRSLCLLAALLLIGIVSLSIAVYGEPAVRSALKRIGGALRPANKKLVLETP